MKPSQAKFFCSFVRRFVRPFVPSELWSEACVMEWWDAVLRCHYNDQFYSCFTIFPTTSNTKKRTYLEKKQDPRNVHHDFERTSAAAPASESILESHEMKERFTVGGIEKKIVNNMVKKNPPNIWNIWKNSKQRP